jgi:hypothetical protein
MKREMFSRSKNNGSPKKKKCALALLPASGTGFLTGE